MLQKAKMNEIMLLRLCLVHGLVEMFPNATPFRISKTIIFHVPIVVVFFFSTPPTPAAKQGRRLSLIGERFKVEVGKASSLGSSSK